MAQTNFIVIGLALLGLTLDLVNIAMFDQQIQFWFGYIFDVFAIIWTIVLLVYARCIQALFYRDQYAKDQLEIEGAVVEIVTKRSDSEPKDEEDSKKPSEPAIEEKSIEIIVEEKTKEQQQLETLVEDAPFYENLKLSFNELRQRKVYSFLLISYAVFEFCLGVKLIQRCAIQYRASLVESKSYPTDCPDFSK